MTHKQLEQVVGREAETRSSLDGYKQEAGQLLAANAALMEQNQALSKRVQVRGGGVRNGGVGRGWWVAGAWPLCTLAWNPAILVACHS